MLTAAAVLIIAGAVLITFFVREKDIPVLAVASPYAHLDDRKAQIYENLRDLQFEFRVGKLSDEDYQKTKLELQGELAKVLSEIDRLKGPAPKTVATPSTAPLPAPSVAPTQFLCPHCNAAFDLSLKFCGECGKPMTGGPA
jgi:hypothetical protein